MEKKYIIELKDNTAWLQWVNVLDDGQVYFDFKYPEDLTPYTEPNLDAIKQEEYEKGYKTAKVQCNIQAEKDLREVGERHYQKGLNDAWEAAKKIALDKEDGGLDTVAYCETFGYGKGFGTVLKTFTASECIEKIRQYEQEQRVEYNFDEIKDVIQTTAKEYNMSLDEIAEVLAKMKETE